jgi:hypothetical protein
MACLCRCDVKKKSRVYIESHFVCRCRTANSKKKSVLFGINRTTEKIVCPNVNYIEWILQYLILSVPVQMNFTPNLCKSDSRQQRLIKDCDRHPQLSVYRHIESANRFYRVRQRQTKNISLDARAKKSNLFSRKPQNYCEHSQACPIYRPVPADLCKTVSLVRFFLFTESFPWIFD